MDMIYAKQKAHYHNQEEELNSNDEQFYEAKQLPTLSGWATKGRHERTERTCRARCSWPGGASLLRRLSLLWDLQHFSWRWLRDSS